MKSKRLVDQMKKYLYVDTENTGLSFINIVNRMGKSWHVSIFYSDKSPKLSFAEMDLLDSSRCSVKYRHCRNGRPNAMDFCIMTQLGMSVRKHPDAIHLVLSRDKGYLSGIEMLRDKGYFVGEIVMDEVTGVFGWVSETADQKPYEVITHFMDGLVMPGQEDPRSLPASSGQGAAAAADRSQGAGKASEPKYMPEQALEKHFVRILMSSFESVGVDRKRKCLGQVVRKGLHMAYAKGELNLEQLEYHIRKLASFRGSAARTQRFLQAVSEIPDIMITGAEKTLLVIDAEGAEAGTGPEEENAGTAARDASADPGREAADAASFPETGAGPEDASDTEEEDADRDGAAETGAGAGIVSPAEDDFFDSDEEKFTVVYEKEDDLR